MKLPPMNALRAFEAVSRHLSVSKAADELCVSQGAVSQQIRNLEDHLGRDMFIRSPHSFSLSEEGEAFAVVVQKALAEIGSAADEVTRINTRHTLTISVPPSLAVKWLMPKLGEFYRKFSDITIALDQSVRLATFKNDGVDAGIRFGGGNLVGLESVFLFTPQLFAVASPAYIAANGRLDSLTKPYQHHLIDHQYASKEAGSQHTHWEDFVSVESSDAEIQYSVYPDEHQGFNAAIQGQGIALVSAQMMEDEIETGIIEYVNEQSTPARSSYCFVSPTDARPNNALIAFRDWLVAETEKYRNA